MPDNQPGTPYMLEAKVPNQLGPQTEKGTSGSEPMGSGQPIAFTRPPEPLPGPENHPFFADVAGPLSPSAETNPTLPSPVTPLENAAAQNDTTMSDDGPPSLSNVPPPSFPTIRPLSPAALAPTATPTHATGRDDDDGTADRPTDAPAKTSTPLKTSAYSYRYRLPHGGTDTEPGTTSKEVHIQGFLWHGRSWRRNMWFAEVAAADGMVEGTERSPSSEREISA
ncbi:hypothetical protein P152DRAFT_185084 [Eremomyces bilateralis CBS 781.70]|uniref:Uncharacterized protein n=1 Tax=Eremomyces bilateralis CBS 781.70 TaxID=1392243 RepID=A0A6G1GBZ6_9PEZI|nr:uncharacterized protein P152DRAFT_185084 [Eremomyces bilateralis CBS 781.70]KAF1815420.1 hypothetical protein P152DRAFT_185084 [Eremomyces bilateralis CBS 781.70]